MLVILTFGSLVVWKAEEEEAVSAAAAQHNSNVGFISTAEDVIYNL